MYCVFVHGSLSVCMCVFTVLTHYVHFLTLKKSKSHDTRTLSFPSPPFSAPSISVLFPLKSMNAQRNSPVIKGCVYICMCVDLYFVYFLLHTHLVATCATVYGAYFICLTLTPRISVSCPLWSGPGGLWDNFQSFSHSGSIYLMGQANPSAAQNPDRRIHVRRKGCCLKKSVSNSKRAVVGCFRFFFSHEKIYYQD